MPPRTLSSALPLWRNRGACSWRHSLKRKYTTPTDTTALSTEYSGEPHPTPSQFLRFGLMATTRARGKQQQHDAALDEHLERIFSTTYVSEQQKKSLFSPASLRDLQNSTKGNVATLSDVLMAIERRIKSVETAQEFAEVSADVVTVLEHRHGRMQYEELLAVVNAIFARLSKFDVSAGKAVCLRGMFYASVCCSPAALEHYVSLYSDWEYEELPSSSAGECVMHLLSGLKARAGEYELGSLKERLRKVVEGDLNRVTDSSSRSSGGTFHSLLKVSPQTLQHSWMGQYAELLGAIGARQTLLLEIWEQLLAQFAEEHEGMENATAKVQDNLNSCLRALVVCGEAQTAITAVRDLSSTKNLNEVISVDVWKLLLLHDTSRMLRHTPSQRTASLILQSQLDVIEASMGITWTQQNADGDGHHRVIAHDTVPIVINSPEEAFKRLGLVTATADTATAARIGHRLLTFVRSISDEPSTSLSSLNRLADILTEYEDTTIPLGTNTAFQHDYEYAWFPQVAPLEFAGHETPAGRIDASTPRGPAALGLLRVRRACIDEPANNDDEEDIAAPLRSGETGRLMQMGYIGARRRRSDTSSSSSTSTSCASLTDSSREAQETETETETGSHEPARFTPTGHILCWDRQRGGFSLVWTGLGVGVGPGSGSGSGTVRPGLVAGSPPPSLPYTNATILMRCDPVDGTRYLDGESICPSVGEGSSGSSSDDSGVRYWIDLDTADDLAA